MSIDHWNRPGYGGIIYTENEGYNNRVENEQLYLGTQKQKYHILLYRGACLLHRPIKFNTWISQYITPCHAY